MEEKMGEIRVEKIGMKRGEEKIRKEGKIREEKRREDGRREWNSRGEKKAFEAKKKREVFTSVFEISEERKSSEDKSKGEKIMEGYWI